MGPALTQVVPEEALTRLFDKKPLKDVVWRLVEYIQTTVKDPVGVGKPIII
jgi:hypothetical protein